MTPEQIKSGFEQWISETKLVTHYGAKLHVNSTGDQYKDLRVNQRWNAWRAAVQFMQAANPDRLYVFDHATPVRDLTGLMP